MCFSEAAHPAALHLGDDLGLDYGHAFVVLGSIFLLVLFTEIFCVYFNI